MMNSESIVLFHEGNGGQCLLNSFLLDPFNVREIFENIGSNAKFSLATISFFKKSEEDLIDEIDIISTFLATLRNVPFEDAKKHVLNTLERKIIEREGLKLPK